MLIMRALKLESGAPRSLNLDSRRRRSIGWPVSGRGELMRFRESVFISTIWLRYTLQPGSVCWFSSCLSSFWRVVESLAMTAEGKGSRDGWFYKIPLRPCWILEYLCYNIDRQRVCIIWRLPKFTRINLCHRNCRKHRKPLQVSAGICISLVLRWRKGRCALYARSVSTYCPDRDPNTALLPTVGLSCWFLSQ